MVRGPVDRTADRAVSGGGGKRGGLSVPGYGLIGSTS